MLDADTVFDTCDFSYADSEHLADLWNAAYPAMREISTRCIEARREAIERKAWEVDPKHPAAEALRKLTPDENKTRRRLKQVEELRLVLGQLDRGTHKLCTRSPGAFSVTGALMAVRNLLNITSMSSPGLHLIYRLAAVLAEAEAEINIKRASWHRERMEKEKEA